MTAERKARIKALLKGIETGDPTSVEVVNEEQYIQHNPHTREGSEGLAALFKRISQNNPRVNIVRIFADRDFVFGHTEYDFSSSKIGFEVFRFEGDYAVEHWDNIQALQGPNPSGRSMVDGTTDVVDLEQTEANREVVRRFVDEILIKRDMEQFDQYFGDSFIQHNPQLPDGVDALRAALEYAIDNGPVVQYNKNHRLLAEGNFVLSVSEGYLAGAHTSFYDLFRLEKGLLVEHWDTTETVPPRSEWRNDNGKF